MVNFINGGAGADLLTGTPGDDFINGLEGNDTLRGGAGADVLDGGLGADTFVFARGDGPDTIAAGPGSGTDATDTLQFGPGISMADVDVRPEQGDLVLSVRGGSGHDSVRLLGYLDAYGDSRMRISFADGSVWDALAINRHLAPSPDMLYGTPGPDVLDAGAGDDIVAGMDGNDTLYGDTGNDRLFGGQGTDVYYFGRGDGQDTISATNDEIIGDRLRLSADISQADVTLLTEGSDLILSIQGSHDSVRLQGYFDRPGMDRPLIEFANGATWDAVTVDRKRVPPGGVGAPFWLGGTAGNDALDGGAGDDQIQGMLGDDTLYGDAGNDLLDGGPGADAYIFGRGDGQDTIVADGGNPPGLMGSPDAPAQPDQLRLGAGISLSDVSLSLQGHDLLLSLKGSADSVRVANYLGQPEPQRLLVQFADGSFLGAANINRKLALGSAQVVGSAQSDVINGSQGSDTLIGQDGDDTLYGDAGNDWLDGGLGADTFYFGRGDGQDTLLGAWNTGPGQQDTLRLGAGINMADVVLSNQSGDLLLSLPSSTSSPDSLRIDGYFAPAVPERLRIEFADGSYWDGLAVDRLLSGGPAFMPVTPQGDLLVGSQGNDILNGQDGDDTLYGDAGDDLLNGGYGTDTYYFGRGDGHDSLVANSDDWANTRDELQWASDINAANLSLSAQGSDLLLSLANLADSVRLIDYFNEASDQRLLMRFGTSGVWDNLAVQRKLYASDDQLNGSSAEDLLDGGLGNDTLVGLAGNDTLYGDDGNDLLDGGLGADTYLFALGDGQDTIIGTAPAALGEADTLQLGEGIAISDLSVSLNNGALLLQRLASSDSVRVLGYLDAALPNRLGVRFANGQQWDAATLTRKLQASDDTLIGSEQADLIDGGLGHDTLIGLGGDDALYGDAGNDSLDGGLGADTLDGGAGNDTYVLRDKADTIVETSTGGQDAVQAWADGIQLADNVERLTLQGTANWSALGNEGANTLTGNAGGNALYGQGGNDFLYGLAGNDSLYGGKGADILIGDRGNDSYYLQRGAGSDMVFDVDATVGNSDKLVFEGDINAAQLWFSRAGSNLVVSVIGTNDKFSVLNWYLGSSYRVENIVAGGNGKTLTADKVQNLVNAMASFTPPPLGQTNLSAAYDKALASVIAANWA
jgi:Ca2+-binding RTX toxin-like protein